MAVTRPQEMPYYPPTGVLSQCLPPYLTRTTILPSNWCVVKAPLIPPQRTAILPSNGGVVSMPPQEFSYYSPTSVLSQLGVLSGPLADNATTCTRAQFTTFGPLLQAPVAPSWMPLLAQVAPNAFKQ